MAPIRVLAVMVYAAVSLREPLLEIAPGCGAGKGEELIFNFGASGDLARQIQAAGRADLFFSADEEWLDRLERAALLETGTRRSILSNRLVVVGPVSPGSGAPPIGSAADLAGPGVRRIAIASPESVPAGRYARLWLERAGLWDRLVPRLVPALDARAALAAVESGLVEAGIVYATDAASSRRVRILFEVPAGEAPPISYGAAALAGRPRLPEARRALDCLTGAAAMEVFARHGFLRPAPAAGAPPR